MEKRYPHFLRPTSAGRWPSVVVFADVIGAKQQKTGNARSSVERFVSFYTTTIRRATGQYVSNGLNSGTTVAEFWSYLQGLRKAYGTIWIVSYQCTRVWSLLQLWEGIENGRICFTRNPTGDRALRPDDVLGLRTGNANAEPVGTNPAMRGMPGWHVGSLVCEDPPCIADFRLATGGQSIIWLDSRNWTLPDYQDVARGRWTCEALEKDYLNLCGICDSLSLGAVRRTLASTGYAGLRHGYFPAGLHCHVNPVAGEIEEAGYYGGRAECFQLGAVPETVSHYDMHCAYGSIVAQTALPARLLRIIPEDELRAGIDGQVACRSICTVRIDTDRPDYPVRRNGLTIWPVGRYTTTLAGPELSDAILHGRVVDVVAGCEYEMGCSLAPFAQAMLNAISAAENRGDRTTRSILKRMLVSLVGKLGQRIKSWEFSSECTTDILYGEWFGADSKGEVCRYRAIGGVVQRCVTGSWSPDALPATAAFVTSLCRLKLLELMRAVGHERVVYVDTDTIMYKPGHIPLERLGFIPQYIIDGNWILQDRGKDLVIRGIKSYTFGDKVVASGVAKSVTYTQEGGQELICTVPVESSLRRHTKPEAAEYVLPINAMPKYRHGTVRADGRIVPIELKEF